MGNYSILMSTEKYILKNLVNRYHLRRGSGEYIISYLDINIWKEVGADGGRCRTHNLGRIIRLRVKSGSNLFINRIKQREC